jgi:hypothetical protein
LIQHRGYKAERSGSVILFFSQLSRGHGSLSTSLAPGRRGSLLLPLRGPPVSGFLPKRLALPKRIFSGSSRKRRAWPREQPGELGVHLSHLKRRLELLREDKALTERSREGLRDFYRHECDKVQLELKVLNKMERVGTKEKDIESASKKIEFAQSEAGREQARRIWQRRGAGMALSGGPTSAYRLAQFPDNPEEHELKIAKQQRAEASRLLTAAQNDLEEASLALEKARLEETKWNSFKAEAERWELRQRWESITPQELQPPIRAIRKAFENRCWEFEQCTMKLCHAPYIQQPRWG